MSQPPYPGQPYPGEPSSGQPHQGQPPYSGQPPFQGQPYQGQPSQDQPYQDQPYQGQPYQGQPYQGEPYQGQPYQGQPPYQAPPPYPGQPNPDVPSSVPPQPGYPPTTAFPPPPGGQQYGQQPYTQSDYAQPQYGQPDYAQQGYGQPGFPPAPPAKKSRTLPIVLTAVGIVLVLCVGGSIALVMAARNSKDKIDDALEATRTPTAAAPTTEPTAEPTTEAPAAPAISITEPKTLGGRPKLTDAQFAAVTEQLEDSLRSVPGATGSVGALYGTVEKQDIVILAAAEAPISDPERELDQAFYGAGVGGLKISNISAAPTGALGGAAKCGTSKTSDLDMAICTWADDGSLGMLIWFNKSVSRAKAEFPKLRAQVEKKS